MYLKNLKPLIAQDKTQYIMLKDEDSIKAVCKQYMSLPEAQRIIAIDTETTDLNHKLAGLVGISLCFTLDKAYYIPISHKVGENFTDFNKFSKFFNKMLYASSKVLFFNARFDMRILRESSGLDPFKVKYFDTQLLVWNADTNVKRLGLKWCMENILKWKFQNFEDVVGDSHDISYIDSKDVVSYASMDAAATFQIWEMFKGLYEKQLKTVVDLDNACLLPLMVEEEGLIPVDVELLKSYKPELESRMARLEESIYESAGSKFNIGSTKQLIEVFKKLGINTGQVTDKGSMSTGEAALVPLQKDYPFVASILEVRGLKKLMGTYVDTFIEEAEKHNGGVYFNYKVTEAATGRLAGGGDKLNSFFASINCQNMPKTPPTRYKLIKGGPIFGYGYKDVGHDDDYDFEALSLKNSIRHAIKAKPGELFFHGDFAAQEIRLIANLTGCKMVDFIQNGLDIHEETAKMLFGAEYETDKKKYRTIAKTINFAVAYGGGAGTVGSNLGISREEAQVIVDKWWSVYPEIKKWNAGEVVKAKKCGYVKTYFGRQRWVHEDLASEDRRGYAMRTIINSPIQGTAADISKLALHRIHNNVLMTNEDIKLLLCVHDEFNFSVPADPNRFLELAKMVKKNMEISVKGWKLPMTADFTVGTSYADGVPVEFDGDKIILCGKYEVEI